jgi:hypothetical protein
MSDFNRELEDLEAMLMCIPNDVIERYVTTTRSGTPAEFRLRMAAALHALHAVVNSKSTLAAAGALNTWRMAMARIIERLPMVS